MPKDMYVYIVTNKPNGTLYIGVTNDLRRRVWQHRGQIVPGFTDRYNLTQLVWFEHHAEPTEAIRRGKALKRWNRAWKLDLIAAANPGWRDLWEDIAAD
ncbi:GIY-YIG nuclease family protein [Roseovarius sp.]|uniref:GIY-YIG nuclease family protein n=1 Tax=Roseovarius sp. TaxID=1486281 RepID=UPI003B5CF389